LEFLFEGLFGSVQVSGEVSNVKVFAPYGVWRFLLVSLMAI